jgi:prepilin-type N-terminal cleavage/methylation domain-containing protein
VEMTKLLKSRQGFSLVEITVALVVGAIGLLALSGILTYTMQSNRQATDISIATSLARQKIEKIKLTDYNYVINETENDLDANGVYTAGQIGRYIRVTDVVANAAGPNTKTITVTVFYGGDTSNDARRAQIKTIIYP